MCVSITFAAGNELQQEKEGQESAEQIGSVIPGKTANMWAMVYLVDLLVMSNKSWHFTSIILSLTNWPIEVKVLMWGLPIPKFLKSCWLILSQQRKAKVWCEDGVLQYGFAWTARVGKLQWLEKLKRKTASHSFRCFALRQLNWPSLSS